MGNRVPRLKAAQRKMSAAGAGRVSVATVAERRITGYTNQLRRFRIWRRDPHCQMCGRLVDYPTGFELDHKVPLFQGGPDTDENCQVLCVWWDTDGKKRGCHAIKTAAEAAQQ